MAAEVGFKSMDEFLLHVLTLRSNAVYREDFALLVKESDTGDWFQSQPLDGTVYGAARSLISTWDLICRIAESVATNETGGKAKAIKRFSGQVPLASMWLLLRPAIDELKKSGADPFTDEYARKFDEMGKNAADALVNSPLLASMNVAAFNSPSTKALRDTYRTAAAKTRQLTHFG